MEDKNIFESQLDMRSRLDDELVEKAYSGLVSSMGGSGFREIRGDKFDQAVAICLEYLGAKAGIVPDSCTSPEERMTYLLRPGGIMRRKISLKANWYKQFIGPVLGKLKSGEAVAILPGFFGGGYFINPSTGRKQYINRVNSEDFEENAWFFYPSLPFGVLSNRDFYFFMMRLLRPGDYLSVIAAAIAAVLVGLLPAWVNKLAFGIVIPSGQSMYIAPIAALFLGVTVSTLFINACRKLVVGRISIKTGIYAEAAVYSRLMTLPAVFFRNYDSGNLAVRISAVKELTELLTMVNAGAGLSLILSVIFVLEISIFAPTLTVTAFVIVLIQVVITMYAAFITSAYEKVSMEKNAGLSGTVTSLLNGIQKIKLAGAENRAFYKWAEGYAAYARPTYNRPAVMQALPGCVTVIGILGEIMIFRKAAMSSLSYDDYMAFSVAFGQMGAAILAAAALAQQVVKIKPTMDLLKPIFTESPEAVSDKPMVEGLKGGVELANVSFRYNEKSPYVLKDISFKVNPGEYVAIVGLSGCGKSTLVRLLLGFEKPEKGNIFFDSHNSQAVDLRSLRQHIGTVMQNGRLFVGNIYYNIIISSPKATIDDAWSAAELAGIADDIRKMPMGMNTLISEGGSGLSGGQRQRLMIARAICGKPNILIFDEATSALDNITQKHVSDSLDSMNCTRIVVAHRLSTIRNADRILCLNDGSIVEEGSYDELMNRNGFFAELVRKQQLEI